MREPVARTAAPIALPPRRLRRQACRIAEPVAHPARARARGPRPGVTRPRLPQRPHDAGGRGARRDPLQAGQGPGQLLHRPRQRVRGRRRGHRHGARRRRDADPARHGRAHHPRHRAVARARAVHGALRLPHRAAATARVHLGDLSLGTIPMVSHLPAMLPVACGLALAFQLRREPRVALGWMGDGSAARGDAHEAMNFAGVRRLPMVFVIDNNQYAYTTPEPAGVRDRAPRRARRRLRLRGRRRRRHRPADRLPRGAPRRRARPGRARADADRVRDAAAVRPRRARRRELHAAGAARPLGRPRAGAAAARLPGRAGRLDGRRGAGAARRGAGGARRARWSRRWPARCPIPTRCSTASTPRSRSFRPRSRS